MRTIHHNIYQNLLVRVNNKMIEFKNGKALVSEEVAAYLLQQPGYSLGSHDRVLFARKILIIRSQGLGDVLFTTVLPKFFKKINPSGHITFATFPKHYRVLQNNPDVNEIINCGDNLITEKYDYICALNSYFEAGEMTNYNNTLHRVDMLKRMFERYTEELKLWDNNIVYNTTTEEQEYAQKTLQALRGKKIIAFFPQASEITRRYPDCTGLVTFLADKGYGVVVISPGGELFPTHKNILNLAGQTTIGQMGGLVEASDLVISPDSGPLHLAGALNKKIITFFNSFPPHTRVAYYKNCFAFSAKGNCPINRYPCGYSRCPAECFKKITFQDFHTKVDEMIGRA